MYRNEIILNHNKISKHKFIDFFIHFCKIPMESNKQFPSPETIH